MINPQMPSAGYTVPVQKQQGAGENTVPQTPYACAYQQSQQPVLYAGAPNVPHPQNSQSA